MSKNALVVAAYLQLLEEDAASRPFYDGEQRLVRHHTKQVGRAGFVQLATPTLLLLQVGTDLCSHLRDQKRKINSWKMAQEALVRISD